MTPAPAPHAEAARTEAEEVWLEVLIDGLDIQPLPPEQDDNTDAVAQPGGTGVTHNTAAIPSAPTAWIMKRSAAVRAHGFAVAMKLLEQVGTEQCAADHACDCDARLKVDSASGSDPTATLTSGEQGAAPCQNNNEAGHRHTAEDQAHRETEGEAMCRREAAEKQAQCEAEAGEKFVQCELMEERWTRIVCVLR